MEKDHNTSIPAEKVPDLMHVNHMGIEKTTLLAYESIYWININADIGKSIKITPYVTCQVTRPRDKT